MADFATGASAGLAGWDQHTSQDQLTRSAGSLIGHPDAAALAHLSRALYIPRHDRKATHLAVHDISTQYNAAKGTLPVGCTKYAVAVGVMPKPQGDGPDDITVSYDVDFNREKDEEAVVASLKCRAPSSLSAEVDLCVPFSPNFVENPCSYQQGNLYHRRGSCHLNHRWRK